MDFQYFSQSGCQPVIITPSGESGSLIRPVNIPKSCKMIYAVGVGHGGAGGSGFSRAAGSAGGGGGGGGTGGIFRLYVPANLFRGQMYVRVGAAGSGQSTGIWMTSDAAAGASNFALGQTGTGGAGGNGTGAAAGAAGAIGGSGGASNWLSLPTIANGLSGGAGGAQTGATGTGTSINALWLCSGGSGGAGCTTTNFAGASSILSINPPNYTVSGGTAGGGAGDHGWLAQPWQIAIGGAGGGSNNTGVGGAGGNGGGPGAGGGGGAAGVTGGAGGRGGDGQLWVYFL